MSEDGVSRGHDRRFLAAVGAVGRAPGDVLFRYFFSGGLFALVASAGLVVKERRILGLRDEGGLSSPHAWVYGKWPPADARRVAPGTGVERRGPTLG